MTATNEILRNVKTILVIDWPSKEVPETLALAGFNVVVRGGPGPTDYVAYESQNGEVKTRHTGKPPDLADMIFSFRPLSEIPGILETANRLHVKTIWTQSGLSSAGVPDSEGCWLPEEELHLARKRVESAGFTYMSEPYICDAVRETQTPEQRD